MQRKTRRWSKSSYRMAISAVVTVLTVCITTIMIVKLMVDAGVITTTHTIIPRNEMVASVTENTENKAHDTALERGYHVLLLS